MKRLRILVLLLCPGLHAGELTFGPKLREAGKSLTEPVGDDSASSGRRFVIVPGKDPEGWSFTLEPYLWAIGMAGKIGVKGEPPSSVDYNARTVLQHLDWGIFAKGEVRKDKWGLLADGLFAQLSASGSQPGGLYKDIDVTVQQGMASLALACRVVEDRAWFVDVYAGARYNYLGIDVAGSVNETTLQQLGDTIVERVAAEARAGLGSVIQDELARRGENRRPVLPERAANALHEALAARLKAKAAPEIARAEAAVTVAKRKLASEIAEALRDELSTGERGEQWWVDPIIGARGQINFTRWLFLAAQGDVGGFYAGSRIAWNVQATVGINFTRNVFAEVGYRYFYMDYNRSGAVYDAAEFGLFSGLGVKF
jgi:hypothetical protein